MSISYNVQEGLAGFRRARFPVFTSTSAMTVGLILIGLFGLLTYEMAQVSTWLRQRVGEFEVFLNEDVTDARANALRLQVARMPGVAETELVSRSEAQAVFQEEFGEGADVFFDDFFLPASVRVRVEPGYVHLDSLTALVGALGSWGQVDEVVFDQGLLVKVQENLQVLSLAGLLVGLLVMLSAVFLVANAIRMTMYVRRLLIRTMKLVGATERFIRRPFIIEGIVQGMLAGVLAVAILYGIRLIAQEYLPQLGGLPLTSVALAAGVLVICGVLLGWIGSHVAFRRVIDDVTLH